MSGEEDGTVTDIATWLGQQLDEDKAAAEASRDAAPVESRYASGADFGPAVSRMLFHRRFDAARVLRDVAAKRAILAAVASWQHDYVDGDSWLSCAQAVDPHDEEGVPGSGCADEKRRGDPCECGLERRRNAILYPLAQSYDDRPGFKDEWRP